MRTVNTGTVDFTVCMKDIGIQRRDTFPSTIFKQNTNDNGNSLVTISRMETLLNGINLSARMMMKEKRKHTNMCTAVRDRG